MSRFDITIAGEINLDLILYGLPGNMPVEREILANDFRVTLGGSSSILVHNLAVLGASVGFITAVGSDALGTVALDRLHETSVNLERIVHRDGLSTGVTVLLPHNEGRHILTYPGTMAEMTIADLDIDYLKSARHFHLSSLFLQVGLQPSLRNLFRDLKQAGLTISLDTNDDPADEWGKVLDDLLEYVDILLPNEAEANRMAHRNNLDESLQVLSERVPLIAVKRGAHGTTVQQGSNRIDVAPVPVTPVDTIGAGDSFNAGFLYAFLQGADPAACATAGNITGALSTQRPGGTEAFRERGFLQSFLAKHDFSDFALRISTNTRTT